MTTESTSKSYYFVDEAGDSTLFNRRGRVIIGTEVRREVFKLLRRWEGLRFYAVVRDKQSVLEYVRQRNQTEPDYHYRPDNLYETMAGQLLRQVLHRKPEYEICFASRGFGSRTRALRKAIHLAREQYLAEKSIITTSKIHVLTISSVQSPCLQVTDYFLWALQRFYERKEDRYLRSLWHTCRWVWDMDDVRHTKTGRLYTQQKPLLLEALAERHM